MRLPSRGRFWLAGFIAALLLCFVLLNISLSLKKERANLRSRQNEMLGLQAEFEHLKSAVDLVEGRKSPVKVEGIVQAVDEVFTSIGLSQKVKSVKPLGAREKKYAIEEEADVRIERVTMNEMINILYKIENAPMLLSIRRTALKTSFDNPSLLNLTITVSLVKPR